MFGICNLSIVPVRLEPNHRSEQVSQLLFGDVYKILFQENQWLHIKILYDDYEGFIDANQHYAINEKSLHELNLQTPVYCNQKTLNINYKNHSQTVTQGACLSFLKTNFNDTDVLKGKQPKTNITKTALSYLNAPYLWGGKTPFGIDCSGLSQMVYKINGYKLPRDASEQAKLGESLSFIEESEPGDLAFFDNSEGKITHVGIMLENNQIVHASGEVRIDSIDHNGIFNKTLNKHTHQLRVIKKMI